MLQGTIAHRTTLGALLSTWVALSLALAQAVFLFALMLGMFRARRFFGFGPLFLTVGAIEGLKYFLTTGFDVPFFGMGNVAIGSVIYYPATIAIVLLVYLRENATAARQLVWALVLANLGLGVLMTLVWMGHRSYDNAAVNQQIVSGLWRVLVGSLLTFAGAVAALVLYNRLPPQLPRALRVWLTLAVVAVGDTIAYLTLVSPVSTIAPGEHVATVAGKFTFLAVYAAMIAIYLRFIEFDEAGQSERRPSSDILALLTFRERFRELERQVIRDPLTGAFNRRHLDVSLPEQVESHNRRGESCALLMLDIDHFKQVNDTFGHANGDQALMHFVRVLLSVLGRGDLLFRYGGEEFLVLLPHANADEAMRLSYEMHHALASMPLLLKGESVTLSCTIGIALQPRDGTTAGELFSAADRRLYRGKQRGRRCTVAEDAGRSGRT